MADNFAHFKWKVRRIFYNEECDEPNETTMEDSAEAQRRGDEIIANKLRDYLDLLEDEGGVEDEELLIWYLESIEHEIEDETELHRLMQHVATIILEVRHTRRRPPPTLQAAPAARVKRGRRR